MAAFRFNPRSLVNRLRFLRMRLYRRYTPFTTRYPGFYCHVVDKSSFMSMCEEILDKEIYAFNTDIPGPYIIDAGANIGLATIYFKKRFPKSTITAFEPDPIIANALKLNLAAADCADGVTVVEACVGSKEGTITFHSDGADGGTTLASQNGKAIQVPQVTLLPYLRKQVDLLKIDIEGAETEVVQSIAEHLANVERLFIEYHSFADGEQTLDEILRIIKNAGFRYYLEQSGVRSRNVYVKREVYKNMDAQVNIYGYRDR